MSFLSSMMTSLSGLEVHAQKLSVIGQNITNINTVGYRDRTIDFSTVLEETNGLAGASASRVQVRTSLAAERNGTFDSTGIQTDMALTGRGFFVVNTRSDGSGETLYTRDGSFRPDQDGFLRNKGGVYLQGYDVNFGNSETTTTGPLTTVQIDPALRYVPGLQTTDVRPRLNFPAENRQVAETSVPIFSTDSANARNLVLNWSPVAGEGNQWDLTFDIVGGEGTVDPASATPTRITFGPNGQVVDPVSTTANVTWNPYVDSLTGETVNRGAESINFDWSNLVIGGDAYVTYDTGQNGAPLGNFREATFDSFGVLSINADIGASQPTHKVAVAMFNSPDNLTELDANTFVANSFTGDAILTVAGAEGAGNFLARTVELSNSNTVDLLSQMIEAQRAYTFSSSALRTANELMEIAGSLK